MIVETATPDVVTLGRDALGRLGAWVGALYLASAVIALLAGAWNAQASRTGETPGPAVLALAACYVACALAVQAVARSPFDPWRAGLRFATVLVLAGATAWTGALAHDAGWGADQYLASVVATAGGCGLALGAGWAWGVGSCAASLAGLGAAIAVAGDRLLVPPFAGAAVSTAVAVVVVVIFSRGFALTERELVAAGEASLAQRVSAERWRARRRTDRQLHDTVLSTLSLLSHDEFRASTEVVRELCRRDLAVLEHDDSTLEGPVTPPGGAPAPGAGLLAGLVERWAGSGLAVRLHGAPWEAAVQGLPPAAEAALHDAAAECVSNTFRHAGVEAVDVVVLREAAAVGLLVVDAGAGFDPDAVAPDRFGIADSVHGRLAEVRGTAAIWSRPGEGATVFLSVPLPAAEGAA